MELGNSKLSHSHIRYPGYTRTHLNTGYEHCYVDIITKRVIDCPRKITCITSKGCTMYNVCKHIEYSRIIILMKNI